MSRLVMNGGAGYMMAFAFLNLAGDPVERVYYYPHIWRCCHGVIGARGVVACLCAYVVGLVILMVVTTLLLSRDYDEGFFMAIAAADVFGAMFVFGSVALTFALYSGVFAVRLLDFFLLLGIVIVAFSLSSR